MIDKTFCFWLLLLAIGVAGCEKLQPANRPATTDKEQSSLAEKSPTQKLSFVSPDGKTDSNVSRTSDMPSYQWPADFKLPLEINIETPQVPEEIQGPSPPLEEDKK